MVKPSIHLKYSSAPTQPTKVFLTHVCSMLTSLVCGTPHLHTVKKWWILTVLFWLSGVLLLPYFWKISGWNSVFVSFHFLDRLLNKQNEPYTFFQTRVFVAIILYVLQENGEGSPYFLLTCSKVSLSLAVSLYPFAICHAYKSYINLRSIFIVGGY